MKQASKRLSALLLSLTLLLTSGAGQAVYATEGDSGPALGASGEITAFATLTQITAAVGTEQAALPLPDALEATATMDGGDGPAEQLVSVPVESWACPAYDKNIAEPYDFAPTLGGAYTLAPGVELPALTVTLENEAATPTQIMVADFDPLPEDVAWQGYDAGTIPDASGLTLPDKLTGRRPPSGEDAEGAPLTIEGVTWACVKAESMAGEAFEQTAFAPDTEGKYTFSPVLPQGYVLAEGVTLPEITVIVRPAGGVSIVPMSLNDDLAVGTWAGTDSKPGNGHRWVEFGGRIWRVLEVKEEDHDNDVGTQDVKTALLLAEESVGRRSFHGTNDPGANNWCNSDIRAWLNSEEPYSGATDGFYNGNFSDDEKAAIVVSSYKLGGIYDPPTEHDYDKDTLDASRVFLLSTDDAENEDYFADSADKKIGDNWWLRSPSSSSYVDCLLEGSDYVAGSPVKGYHAIRPALKINLESGIFTSKKPLYEVTITVESSDSPVTGARVSFSGGSAPDDKFVDSDGKVTVLLEYGEVYTITISKYGYEDRVLNDVTISQMGQAISVGLTANASLPATVQFGTPDWQVINIDETSQKALLLANTYVKTGMWYKMDEWINSTDSDGFLEAEAYFTAAEQAAMTIYSETSSTMFMLSGEEVGTYLPHTYMRLFPMGTESSCWWLRSRPSNYHIVWNETGLLGIDAGGPLLSEYDVRPAVWVDLTKLCQKEASGDIILMPTYSPTITVKDSVGTAIDGAAVTLTYSGSDTYRTWDGNAFPLTGTTAGGGSAVFNLPEGSYTVTATKSGYVQQSTPVTLIVNGNGAATANVVMNDTQEPTVTGVTPSDSGIAVSGNIVITFDEAMQSGAGTVTLTPSGGGTQTLTGGSLNNPTNTIYTISYTGLEHNKRYTIGISGFKDVAGNVMNTPSQTYSFTTALAEQVAAPIASPPGGEYSVAQTVALTSTTSGAAIYYTLDGSNPLSSGTRQTYSGPITVAMGTTVKAYATKGGWTDSAVMTADYTQKTDPGATTYRLTVTDGRGGGDYEAGAVVPISANTAPTGKVFDKWELTSSGGSFANAHSTNTTFTMPANAATVTATYRDEGGSTTYYTITASAGQGGVITPSGDNRVAEGGSLHLTIKPNTGYRIAYVLVDDVSVGAVENYTFSNITSGHTIAAYFSEVSSGSSSSSNSGSDSGASTPDTSAPKTKLPASDFSWDGGRTLTIKHDSITVLGLVKVEWDGKEVSKDNYTATSGSVIITFSQSFIDRQTSGNHTVRVEFLNHYGETTVTVGDSSTAPESSSDGSDNAKHNPNTGGDTSNPQTGDGGLHPLWWLWVLIPATVLAGLVCTMLVRRKSRAEE